MPPNRVKETKNDKVFQILDILKHGVEPETACSSSTVSMLMKDQGWVLHVPPNMCTCKYICLNDTFGLWILQRITCLSTTSIFVYEKEKSAQGFNFWKGMGFHISLKR